MRLIVRCPWLFFMCLFVLILNSACENTSQKTSEILSIPMDLTIERFDQQFHGSKVEDIPRLKIKYPFLFPEKFNDSVWIKRQKDSLQLLLLEHVEDQFPSMKALESKMEVLFKHLKYYFPKTQKPRIIGLINNVDYQSKTIYADSLVLISLDTYLGPNHKLYEGIPQYIRQEMDSEYITSHVVDKFAEFIIQPIEDRSLLSQMIYHGKKVYIKDLVLPNTTDAQKMGYTQDQLNWVKDNEVFIWQYFIEKRLLFNTQPSLSKRFVDPAPFSKFYLEIDNESPGRIGIWLGWQIIKSYMERHPKTEIQALLNLPAQTLFSKSNYKPRR